MAIPKDDIAGLILIGGQSERMGSPKASIEIGGIPLWQRAVSSVSPFVDRVFFLGQVDGFAPPPPFVQFADQPPGIGPLGGLAAGLKLSGYRHHLLLAIDYPLVPSAVLQFLLSLAPGFDAVCGSNGGFVEPLIGYYHANCERAIRKMLDEQETRTHKLVERVRSLVIPESELLKIDPAKWAFFNVNTPSDLLEADLRLRRGYPQ